VKARTGRPSFGAKASVLAGGLFVMKP